MSTRALPQVPPGRDLGRPLGAVPVSEHWDAVRVSAGVAHPARAVLARTGGEGVLLRDPLSRTYCWLVPVGYAHSVAAELPRVQPLDAGTRIVAARDAARRPHWVVPPAPGRWVTDPAALRAALADALGIELPPLRALPGLGRVLPGQLAGRLCIWCERPVELDAVPYLGQPRRTSARAGRWYPRAHPECA